MAYAFEKLEVWQKSRSLVKIVYRVTKGFPAEERYGYQSTAAGGGIGQQQYSRRQHQVGEKRQSKVL